MAKLKEAACDWLTLTSSEEEESNNHQALFYSISEREGIGSAWRKKADWQGYAGYRVDHMFYGTRLDGSCLILSGPLAALYAGDALDYGGRPSRLDLQITGEVEDTPGVVIERMFQAAKLFQHPTHRPPALKKWEGREGVEGLLVGRRSSDIMLRAYDKGLQSRLPVYKGMLRCEVELKHGMARAAASQMAMHEYDAQGISNTVNRLYAERGLIIPFEQEAGGEELRAQLYVPTVESKMAWLKRQVSPTIQALADELGWERLVEHLLPGSLDTHTGDGRIE